MAKPTIKLEPTKGQDLNKENPTIEQDLNSEVSQEDTIEVIDSTETSTAQTPDEQDDNTVLQMPEESELLESDEQDDITMPQITPVEVTTKKEPMVTIKTLRFHRCTIGGVTYEFEKGVEQKVPMHIKMVLAKQNILKA